MIGHGIITETVKKTDEINADDPFNTAHIIEYSALCRMSFIVPKPNHQNDTVNIIVDLRQDKQNPKIHVIIRPNSEDEMILEALKKTGKLPPSCEWSGTVDELHLKLFGYTGQPKVEGTPTTEEVIADFKNLGIDASSYGVEAMMPEVSKNIFKLYIEREKQKLQYLEMKVNMLPDK